MTPRPFLCSYGGGHANILIAVSRELSRRGLEHDLMGFTTAAAAMRRAGLAAADVRALVDGTEDAKWLIAATELAPSEGHPDVSYEETLAYWSLGFRDLCERLGEAEGRRLVEERGRKAFEPVTAFVRHFESRRPSVVVTTTSPRYEVAAIKAAKTLDIPSVAIGDMFLIAEQEWILGRPYSDHLVVISSEVEQMLRNNGLSETTRIHVLGNPAFDELAPSAADEQLRSALRCDFGLPDDGRLILWPLGGAPETVIGRHLLTANEAGAMLDRICETDPRYRFWLRPHPNWPVPDLPLRYGRIERDLRLEQALLACDIVCVEASTVGLQAVLRGIPTICYNYADYVLYPEFGWASAAWNPEQLLALLRSDRILEPPANLCEGIGKATGRVADLICQLDGEQTDR